MIGGRWPKNVEKNVFGEKSTKNNVRNRHYFLSLHPMKAENIRISRIEPNKGQVEGLPKNPRKVRKSRLDALVRSIEDAPEMLSLRELIVVAHGDRYVVVGGNMRLKALKRLGYKEVPCKVLPEDTPAEKLREYAIKDNEGFGENNYDTGFKSRTNAPLQHTMTHELAHATWNASMTDAKSKAAGLEIKRLYKKWKKDKNKKGHGTYAATSVSEFWSETVTKAIHGTPDRYTRSVKRIARKYKL